MPEPSFPPDSIRAPLVVRRALAETLGQSLAVGPAEVAVFVQNGRVLGTLGPGRHLIDPRAIPFLAQLPATSGVDALVVTVSVHGVRIRGATGEIFDAGSGDALSPRIFGEVGVRIVDANRAALVATSVASGDPDALLRGHVQQAIVEGAKAAMKDAGKAGNLVRMLVDRAAQPELSRAIAAAATPQLAEIGVEISAFGSVVLALSEEDMTKASRVDTTAPPAPVYEMLWDCRFCGQKKLLGLTHRHCPNCGAPQDAEARYFPSDEDKVPAKQHEYYGADVRCTHCGVANSRNSKHCAGCGAPLERAANVSKRRDQVEAGAGFSGDSSARAKQEREAALAAVDQDEAPAGVPKKGSGVRTALRAGCLLVLVAIVAAVAIALWKRTGGLEVVGHTWKREIDVERYGPVSDSTWCDQMPSSARGVSRRKEVRSHERVEDGQDCHTRRVDRGNGTFSEQQECTPRYRDEPVYSDRCYFTVDRWTKSRSATAEGSSIGDAPRWPDASLARAGSCEGCEREGARHETYTVVFRDDGAKDHSCDFDEQRWASFSDGSRWKGALRVVGGGLDCASLSP
jgi:membrane protease subunit (stomatin/prohibitin family)